MCQVNYFHVCTPNICSFAWNSLICIGYFDFRNLEILRITNSQNYVMIPPFECCRRGWSWKPGLTISYPQDNYIYFIFTWGFDVNSSDWICCMKRNVGSWVWKFPAFMGFVWHVVREEDSSSGQVPCHGVFLFSTLSAFLLNQELKFSIVNSEKVFFEWPCTLTIWAHRQYLVFDINFILYSTLDFRWVFKISDEILILLM